MQKGADVGSLLPPCKKPTQCRKGADVGSPSSLQEHNKEQVGWYYSNEECKSSSSSRLIKEASVQVQTELALQLAQICQINSVFMGAMSNLLVASYVVAIFPSTLLLVLLALEVVEWAVI